MVKKRSMNLKATIEEGSVHGRIAFLPYLLPFIFFPPRKTFLQPMPNH